jgi:hypothetical protein
MRHFKHTCEEPGISYTPVKSQATVSHNRNLLIIEPQRLATAISRNIYRYFTLRRIDGTIISSFKEYAFVPNTDAKPMFRRTPGFVPKTAVSVTDY